jgi:DNA-binding transcriptional MerR regulator
MENEGNGYFQGTLFGDSIPELVGAKGYGTPIVSKITGLTRRQIDYWARSGVFEPTIRQARGSGTRRLYSFKDILILQIFKRLEDTGVSVQKIKKAARTLLEHGVSDLSSVTLCSDGVSIFQVRSGDDIIDILKGGQGVFAISVGSIWGEVEDKLRQFPATSTEESELVPDKLDAYSRERNSTAG